MLGIPLQSVEYMNKHTAAALAVFCEDNLTRTAQCMGEVAGSRIKNDPSPPSKDSRQQVMQKCSRKCMSLLMNTDHTFFSPWCSNSELRAQIDAVERCQRVCIATACPPKGIFSLIADGPADIFPQRRK